MKRKLLTAILGIAAAFTAAGQGHLLLSNYLTPPYNQVIWWPSGPAVTDTNIEFQVYYAKGSNPELNEMMAGVRFTLSANPAAQNYDPGLGHGPGGYFLNVIQIFPDWVPGDTYTLRFQAVFPQEYFSSAMWQENERIEPTGNPPLESAYIPQLIMIPEPTALATTVLAVGMLLVRKPLRARGASGKSTSASSPLPAGTLSFRSGQRK